MSFSSGITTASLNFELKNEIGQEGKNSQVYLAHDKQLDANLVIKVIAKATFSDVNEFYAEAKRLYDSEHQHVVQVKYACEDEENIYLAMPFYGKGSLKKLMDKRFLTVREIIRYSIQFLLGLNNIHAKGLIHFDVKPDNILLSDTDEALISDFGLSKYIDKQGLAQPDGFYYRNTPPESFEETQHSMLYDIYSSGVTMYRLCNGNADFYGQASQYSSSVEAFEDAVLKGKFPDRKQYLPHIPVPIRRLINTALSVKPEGRQETILELINQLSPVNELLDWQFVPYDDHYEWTLDTSDNVVTVKLTWGNSLFTTEATKLVKASQRTTKISKASMNDITAQDVDKAVQKLLLDLER